MTGPPFYDETVARLLFDPRSSARHRLRGHDAPTEEIPTVGDHHDSDADGLIDRVDDDQPAATAGEEDHSDPWVFAGEDVDPPEAGEVPDGD